MYYINQNMKLYFLIMPYNYTISIRNFHKTLITLNILNSKGTYEQ